MQTIQGLLNTMPKFRSEKEIQTLKDFTCNIKFFRQEENPEIHHKCCEVMGFEMIPENEFVFNSGDQGDKFYIILRGKVAVKIRINGEVVEVATLGPGKPFGEVALVKEEPRMASIECLENSYFATLKKEDFKAILGKIQKEKLLEKLYFLKSIPLFNSCSLKKIERLSFYFEEKVCNRNFCLFKEGDKVDYMYIVKEGEFILTEKTKWDCEKSLNFSVEKEKNKAITIGHICEKEIIGDEDILNGNKRKYSCFCKSIKSEVYRVKAQDFLTRIKDEISLQFLHKKAYFKNKLRKKVQKGFILARNEFSEASPSPKRHLSNSRPFKSPLNSNLAKTPTKTLSSRNLNMDKLIKNINTGLAPRTPDRFVKSYKTPLSKNLNKFLKKQGYSQSNLKRLRISNTSFYNRKLIHKNN